MLCVFCAFRGQKTTPPVGLADSRMLRSQVRTTEDSSWSPGGILALTCSTDSQQLSGPLFSRPLTPFPGHNRRFTVSKVPDSRLLWSSYLLPALTIIYVVALSYLTLAPDPWWIFGAPGRSAEQTFDSTMADYVQHAIVYSVLGILLAASSRASNRPLPLPLLFGLCHAVGTECLQYWIPPRSCSAVDGLANFVGLSTGWLLVWGVLIIRDTSCSAAAPGRPDS